MTKTTKKIIKHKEIPGEGIKTKEKISIDNEILTETKLKDYVEHDSKKYATRVFDKSLKFKDYYYVNEHDPGGCKTLHCYQDEVNHLEPKKYQEFVNEFLDLALIEVKPGRPLYSIAIMHHGANHLPDLLDYLATSHPSLVIKRMLMGQSDVETLTMKAYQEKVLSSYSSGTYRCGPLLQLSMVGCTAEESGAYLEELLDLMEENHLIKQMLPWGGRSCLEGMPRCSSNDGPILWCRCGEQVVPPMNTASNKGTTKKSRGINELRRLQYLPRASETREVVVEDRTKCHADQVGGLLHKQPTAAVGILKAIHAGHAHTGRRVVKEVVCVDAEHFEAIVDRLKLDLLEPPMSQCVTWLDEARLNQLNREGIRTGRVSLRDNDVYIIPRNVVHQFKTITATTSVAWHVCLRQYHEDGKCSCGHVQQEGPDASELEKNSPEVAEKKKRKKEVKTEYEIEKEEKKQKNDICSRVSEENTSTDKKNSDEKAESCVGLVKKKKKQ